MSRKRAAHLQVPLRIALAVVMALTLMLTAARSGLVGHASGPPTVDGTAPVSWDFNAVAGGTATSVGAEDLCPTGMCDSYKINVVLPRDSANFYQTMTARLKIKYTWTSTAPTDMDIFAYGPIGNKYGPGTPDNISTGAGEEDLSIVNPAPGIWDIRSMATITPVPTAAHAVATLTFNPGASSGEPPPQPGDPTFANYNAPGAPFNSQTAGEPSLGVDWATGSVMYVTNGYLNTPPLTARIRFDDSTTPATATWTDVSAPQENQASADPIGFMDNRTGRFFAVQLAGACSIVAYTDDDGHNWSPSQGCGVPSGADHETVGGGPYAPGSLVGPVTNYKDAIYYCSQQVATAFCARSDTGGITFGPGIPIYNLTQCGGLHGHVQVAPDGTVYVPNKDCGGKAGVAVSTDSGQHWYLSTVPDSQVTATSGSDPSIGIGANNTVYLGYQNIDVFGNRHAMVAISHDRGESWSKSIDVGTSFGIQNMEFATVVAGDDNRAAFAFLGTQAAASPSYGDDQAAGFPGTWRMYVAYTYDGGKTWNTVDATPNDPVQRGCIWDQGGSNPCRNLSDFNGINVDKQGRVVIAYTDGCTGGCETDPSQNKFDRVAAILRQTGGKGLFAAYDGSF